MPVSNKTRITQEEWREVPSESMQVSNLGRIMRQGIISSPRTHVYLRGGRQKWIYRLVLEIFVGPCPPGMECCHYDDNRSNNVLSNLRWGTRTSNLQDRWRNGKGGKTGAIGEKCGAAKLTEEVVRLVRQLRASDPKIWTYKKLANRFGVTQRSMILAISGRTWGHVVW